MKCKRWVCDFYVFILIIGYFSLFFFLRKRVEEGTKERQKERAREMERELEVRVMGEVTNNGEG